MPIGPDEILPFPRGQTFSDAGEITIGDTGFSEMEGKEYWVQDTVHNTGRPVKLRVVKNDSGSAITAANQLLRFSTGSQDFGGRIAGSTSTAGEVCAPVDDAYASAFSIPDDDLFYIVTEGPCNVMSEATTMNLSAHDSCACDNAGRCDGAAATAGQFSFGRIDQASTAENTAVLVWVKADLNGVPAAG